MKRHTNIETTQYDSEEAFGQLEELYGHKLDEGKRAEISRNLSGFFSILHEWQQKSVNSNESEGDSSS